MAHPVLSKAGLDPVQEVNKRHDSLIALRRDFHRHPELGFQETRTVIAERPAKAGLEVRADVAKTGVVGVLRGDKPGRVTAWRADIDALPVHSQHHDTESGHDIGPTSPRGCVAMPCDARKLFFQGY